MINAIVHQEYCTIVDTTHALRCSTVACWPDKWSISGSIAGSSISTSISSCISAGIFVNSSITIGHRPSASSRPQAPRPSSDPAKSLSIHQQKSDFKRHNKSCERWRYNQPNVWFKIFWNLGNEHRPLGWLCSFTTLTVECYLVWQWHTPHGS